MWSKTDMYFETTYAKNSVQYSKYVGQNVNIYQNRYVILNID